MEANITMKKMKKRKIQKRERKRRKTFKERLFIGKLNREKKIVR